MLEEFGLEGLEGRRIVLGRRVDFGLGPIWGCGDSLWDGRFYWRFGQFYGVRSMSAPWCEPLSSRESLAEGLSVLKGR